MSKLQEILKKWIGTPFAEGQRTPGHGVDCVGFVIAVCDELYGFDKWTPEYSPRTPMLDVGVAWQMLIEFRDRYSCVDTLTVEPGDIQVFYPQNFDRVPGHVGIVDDVDPRKLWHVAKQRGVCYTSRFPMSRYLIANLRPTEKYKWLRP